jgi:hypothetical protein
MWLWPALNLALCLTPPAIWALQTLGRTPENQVTEEKESQMIEISV